VVLFSPQYTHDLLANVVDVGAVLPAAAWIDGLRFALFGATALVTVAWIAVCARLIAQGQPLSKIKIALHVSTIGFLAFVWAGLGDLLLGLAIWEVFHDLQYFAITWVHGERLVKKGLGDTSLMRFLFRGRAPLVLLYLAAIAAYGGLNYAVVTRAIPGTTLHAALMAFVFTSTALHYYYDGFLWKVRQDRTRAALDIETQGTQPARKTVGTLAGAAVQIAGFALPLGALALVEADLEPNQQLQVAQRETIRDVVPNSGAAHRNLAVAYAAVGRAQDELSAIETALRLEPDDGIAHTAMATALLERFGQERGADAELHLLRAMELRPRDPLPGVNLALLRLEQGRAQEAVEIYRAATALALGWSPRSAFELCLAGIERLDAGALEAAKQLLLRAAQLEPHEIAVHEALLLVARAQQDLRLEGAALEALSQESPAREDLSLAIIDQRLRAGRVGEAIAGLETWTRAHPEDLDRQLALAEILATHPDAAVRQGPRARELAEHVVQRSERRNVGALDILGAAHAECGDFESAQRLAREALALADAEGLAASATAIRARLAGYAELRAHRSGQ
jgi:Flp pilus assembly protein TadD